jgi:hypothetical protein
MATRGAHPLPRHAAAAPLWPWAVRRVAAAAADAAAPLRPGERRLLSVRDADGRPVLATDLALLHRRDPSAWTRLGWEDVDRADWDPRRGALVLTGPGPDGPRRTELPLADGRRLALLARERIRWTTLLDTDLPLGDLGEARVTARREPGTGALLWVVRPHPDVNRDDPRLPARVDAAIARLRTHAGI